MLEFNYVYGSLGYELSHDLRDKIFGAVQTDDREDISYHLVGYEKTDQIGVARLTPVADEIFEISFVGLKEEYRRQFVGDLVMRALADKAISLGGKIAFVIAPLELTGFFEFEDYKRVGDVFQVDGADFVKMVKDLTLPQKCRGCKG